MSDDKQLLRAAPSRMRVNIGGGVMVKLVQNCPIGHGNQVRIYRDEDSGEVVIVPQELTSWKPDMGVVMVPGGQRMVNVDRLLVIPQGGGIKVGDRVFQYLNQDGTVSLVKDSVPKEA